jgi:hypothetical protein
MHTWTQPPERHPYRQSVVEGLESLGFAIELVPSNYDYGCQAEGREGQPVNHVLVARR